MQNTLESASGVIKKSTRIFINHEDVEILLGCKDSAAYTIIRKVNNIAKKRGYEPFPSGKANKFLFSDVFSIPIEEVDRVISEGKEA